MTKAAVFSHQGWKEQHAVPCPVSKRRYRHIDLAERVTETTGALISRLLLIVALSRTKMLPYWRSGCYVLKAIWANEEPVLKLINRIL